MRRLTGGRQRWARGLRAQIGGTAIGQAATIVAVPLLARLFAPGEFAQVALLTGYLGVVAVVIGLRYEMAVVPARTDADARDAAILALLAGALVGSVATVGLALTTFLGLPGYRELDWPIHLAGWAAVMATAIATPARYLLIRHGETGLVGRAAAAQGLAKVAAQLGLGLARTGGTGLAVAELAGRAAGARAMFVRAGLSLRDVVTRAREYAPLRRIAERERAHVFLGLPSAVVNAVAIAIPVPLLIAHYGTELGGQFALADRLITLPAGLVGAAVADAQFSRMARFFHRAPRHLPRLVLLVALRLAFISAPLGVAVYFLAPLLAGPVLGNRWAEAGVIAALLVPLHLVRFIFAPISRVVLVTGRQGEKLLWDLLLLATGTLSLLLAPRFGLGSSGAILAYAFAQCGVYVVGLFLIARWTAQLPSSRPVQETLEELGSIRGGGGPGEPG